VIANVDIMGDYEANCSAKRDSDPSVRSIMFLLCFDIHERDSNLHERVVSIAI
jgi:hypothetical protein